MSWPFALIENHSFLSFYNINHFEYLNPSSKSMSPNSNIKT
mgnify:CR=1 FL=1|jgi:hypothetical protein